jgi:hypothetical protein
MPDQYRALDHITGWEGPVRGSVDEAQADADAHDQAAGRPLLESTGILTPTVVVRRSGQCCMTLAGDPQPVLPGGLPRGAVPWQDEI